MRKLIFSLMLSAATFTVNPLFAMEIEPDEDTKKSITSFPPSELGLPEIIVEATPHTCACCDPDSLFKNTDEKAIKGSFSSFPNDLLMLVVAKLPLEDILRYSMTSRKMYNLCQRPDLWECIANKEPSWQPQKQIHVSWWGGNRDTSEERATFLNQSVLAKQKPIKGTSWHLKQNICQNPSLGSTTIESVSSSKYCKKDQVISDYVYHLNLFKKQGGLAMGEIYPHYWVKASQLKSFLTQPCTPTSCPQKNPTEFKEQDYKTYHFSIGDNHFEAYLHNTSRLYDSTGVLNITEDILFSPGIPLLHSNNVFYSYEIKDNIYIKKLEQEKLDVPQITSKKSTWEKLRDKGRSIFRFRTSDND